MTNFDVFLNYLQQLNCDLDLRSCSSSVCVDGVEYRRLTDAEIVLLTSNLNSSVDHFNNVFIESLHHTDTTATLCRVRNNEFNGTILLRSQLKTHLTSLSQVVYSCGLRNNVFSGFCCVGKDCVVQNNLGIHNTVMQSDVILVGCGIVSTSADFDGKMFGNSGRVSVGSECGGRSVPMHCAMEYVDMCRMILSPNRGGECLSVQCPNKNLLSSGCQVVQSNITSCLLGEGTVASSVTATNCTFLSSLSRPVLLSGATISGCVFLSHVTVACSGARISESLLFEHSAVTGSAIVQSSVLAPDSEVGGGECLHSLLGPFVGFHHQSLCIAHIWPLGRGNIAYGAQVGANHTGRLNDQECFSGEGCFYGLGVQVKFPFHSVSSPYSIFASGVTCLPQRVSMPFSLFSPEGSLAPINCIKPGWILKNNPFMLDRCEIKFRKRRKSSNCITDSCIFRADIMEMVLSARAELSRLLTLNPTPEVFTEANSSQIGKNVLSVVDCRAGLDAYDMYIERYALKGVFKFVEKQWDEGNGQLPACIIEDMRNSAQKFDMMDPLQYLEQDCTHRETLHSLWVWTTLRSGRHVSITDELNSLLSVELQHVVNVKKCRERDFSRGIRIIEDYDKVHTPLEEDETVLQVEQNYDCLRQKISIISS